MKFYNQSLVFLMTSSLSLSLLAGSLDSPGEPGNASSAMYTLQAICDRLDTGADGSQSTFTEPTTVASSTGCTLNQVMDKAPAKDNTDGVDPSHVVTGKKYWGLMDGNWGLQTGTGIPRFADNNNGTVTDNLTGLIWLKNANCGEAMNWTNALNFANTLFDGSSIHNSGDCELSDNSSAGDWRLPNFKELQSLIDFSQHNPTLSSGHPFLNLQTLYYWSSTTFMNNTSHAWYVKFNDGNVSDNVKTSSNYVWPVRN